MDVIKTYFNEFTRHCTDFYNYIKVTLSRSSRNVRPSVNTLLTQFGFYFVVYLMFCYLTYVFFMLFRDQLSRTKHFYAGPKRVLIVIARPFDECKFFGPLIVRLAKSRNCVLYLLCLSDGNRDNQGRVRKKELWSSCRVLGIRSENISLLCSSQRRDGHQHVWKSEHIAPIIHRFVETLDINTVVTFDKLGVDKDSNHISLFRAVSYLALRNELPPTCHIFVLDSLGLVRRYTSMMDSVWSMVSSEHVFVLSPYEFELVGTAMRMHQTQFYWYHQLYILFSRYTHVNTFSEIKSFHQ